AISPNALINSQNETSNPENAMRSAMDQRTIVVTKRKMKTERGVTVFGSACSSVAGMHSHHLDGQELCPQITYANADEFAAERRCHRVPYNRPGRRGSNQTFPSFLLATGRVRPDWRTFMIRLISFSCRKQCRRS